jgi:hypothetical protein
MFIQLSVGLRVPDAGIGCWGDRGCCGVRRHWMAGDDGCRDTELCVLLIAMLLFAAFYVQAGRGGLAPFVLMVAVCVLPVVALQAAEAAAVVAAELIRRASPPSSSSGRRGLRFPTRGC